MCQSRKTRCRCKRPPTFLWSFTTLDGIVAAPLPSVADIFPAAAGQSDKQLRCSSDVPPLKCDDAKVPLLPPLPPPPAPTSLLRRQELNEHGSNRKVQVSCCHRRRRRRCEAQRGEVKCRPAAPDKPTCLVVFFEAHCVCPV